MSKICKTSYLKCMSKIITFVLILIFFLLILSVINIIIKHLLQIYFQFDNKQFDYITPIIASSIDIVIVSICAVSKVKNTINKLYYKMENIIYRFIKKSIKSYYTKYLLLNDFNSSNLTPYITQEKIINRFCINLLNNKKDFFYIEGKSNSGKTASMYQCFAEGIDDIELFKLLDKKTVYICRSVSESQIHVILDKYKSKKFRNNVVIIDDIGDYSIEIQIKLWHYMVEPYINTKKCEAKLLVFIGRNDSSMIFSQLNNIDRESYIINLKNDIYNLGESSEKIDYFCKKNKIYDICMKKWLVNVFSCKTGELILYSLINQDDTTLYTLFVCVVIVSQHFGVFEIKTLKKLFKYFENSPLLFYINLNKLLKYEIISYFPMYNKTIYFNRSINNFFRKKMFSSQQYKNAIINYNKIMHLDNCVEKWLLFVECYALNPNLQIKNNKMLFEKAFLHGNYQYLLEKVEFIFKMQPKAKKFFYRELGYLHEKIGNRKEAIKYLMEYIKSSKEDFEKQQSQLLLFEILHHDNQDMTQINQLLKSKNRFIKFQAEYWKEHMKIEKGVFSFNTLHNIIIEYSSRASEWKEYLNYFHILRRMFSDLVRVYFLDGDINIQKFNNIKSLMNESKLKNYHSEYNDYYRLFFKAHYIHYDVIFQLGFYKYLIHKCDNSICQNPKFETYLRQAIDEYERCEKNFKSYGDKAWRTISIRKNELYIAADVQLINVIQDLEYMQKFFVESQNYLHYAFVNCILCKAKFIQFFMNNLDSDFTPTYNECILLLNLSYKHYSNFHNEYGMYRIDFIKCFLDYFQYIDSKDSECTFRNSINSLKKIKYHREYEMIECILNKKRIQTDLVYRFFKFYPIVLQ